MIRDDTRIFTSWVVKRKTRTQYPQKSLVNLLYTWTFNTASRHKPTEQHIRKNRYFTHKWLACTKTITWITAVFSGQSLTPRERNRSNGKNRLQNSPYFAYSSTREQSNKRSGMRLGRVRLARFARVRLLRHALPISFTDFEKKNRLFCSLREKLH